MSDEVVSLEEARYDREDTNPRISLIESQLRALSTIASEMVERQGEMYDLVRKISRKLGVKVTP